MRNPEVDFVEYVDEMSERIYAYTELLKSVAELGTDTKYSRAVREEGLKMLDGASHGTRTSPRGVACNRQDRHQPLSSARAVNAT